MIHLVTGADDAYAPGLFVTVASSLAALPATEKVTFHILDGGLTARSIGKLRTLCLENHADCLLVFHEINQHNFQNWRPGPHGSMMTYARLLLGSLIKANKVIYLDSDMLVLGDLNELWKIPMHGMMALGCNDGRIPKLGDDSPLPLSREEEGLPYINAGLIVLDLDQWRLQKMEEQVLALMSKDAVVYNWWDQTILNYLLRHQIGIIPIYWNWQDRTLPVHEAASVKVIHYKSKKPWFWWSGDIRFRIWRSFYRKLIGSPLRLFLTNHSCGGFFYGIFETQIRRHPLLRKIYVHLLVMASALRKSSSAQATIAFYTQGLGGSSGDVEFAKKQPVLKICTQAWEKYFNCRL